MASVLVEQSVWRASWLVLGSHLPYYVGRRVYIFVQHLNK